MAPPTQPGIDIGHGVTIVYTSYGPHDRAGLIEYHPCRGGLHGGSVLFDLPGMRDHFPGRALWQITRWEPLTLTPSVLCRRCGHHGWITDGAWVPA